MSEKGDLFKEFNQKKGAISSLRTRLVAEGAKKEKFFQRKRELGEEIARGINETRALKKGRDKLTKVVKGLKGERRKYNDSAKEIIGKIKGLHGERKEIQKKFNIKGDPSKIQEEMEAWELKIETEPMSFTKEKQLMKKIKELKKKSKEVSKISDVWDKIHKVGKEIDERRAKAEEAHKKIQKTAEESQAKHEEFISLSKEVKELRKEEEEVLKKFVEAKGKYDEIKKKLETELLVLNELGKKVGEVKTEKSRQRKVKRERDLQAKGKSVEEKIKRGEKLTTEDLLAFQANEGK